MSNRAISSYFRKQQIKSIQEKWAEPILLLFILLLSLWISESLLTNREVKREEIALSDFQSFRIPEKQLIILAQLSNIYQTDFGEKLAQFTMDQKGYPPGTISKQTPKEIEKYYFLDYNISKTPKRNKLSPNEKYHDYTQSLIRDMAFFPIPFGYTNYIYSDSFWLPDTNRQSTMIYNDEQEQAPIPVCSMTSGKILQKGMNDEGAFIEILSDSHIMYRYSHMGELGLDLQVDNYIEGGRFLGFMGSYMPKTLGIEITIIHEGEAAYHINPYPFLFYIDNLK